MLRSGPRIVTSLLLVAKDTGDWYDSNPRAGRRDARQASLYGWAYWKWSNTREQAYPATEEVHFGVTVARDCEIPALGEVFVLGSFVPPLTVRHVGVI